MRKMITRTLAVSVMVGSVALTVWGDTNSPPTAPTTQAGANIPATQPVGVTIHGRVNVANSWTLQKPDLSRVVVYLASDPVLDAAPRPAGHATVAQKNKAFSPNFSVIPKGTDVEFPNWDNFDHNVFSCSKAAPAFDLDRYPKGQSKTRTFEKVGVVQVFCNIHPSMRAIIFVTPNIYFTRADAQGNFQLTNVPPGKYQIVAWQERCGDQDQPIVVNTSGNADVTFTLEENRQSILANNPPQRGAGYGVERGLGVKHDRLDLPVVKESHAALDPEK
jgi:plastocyanin